MLLNINNENFNKKYIIFHADKASLSGSRLKIFDLGVNFVIFGISMKFATGIALRTSRYPKNPY
jgi:hypothetical protein